jgi:D-lactate dehydrogenase
VAVAKANQLGIKVANVPAYSPHAIAEHAITLLLALARRLEIADRQVHAQNFTVSNLVGFELHGKTVGIIGTGKTGSIVAKILHGFGCTLLGNDIHEDNILKEKYGLQYVDLDTLCRQSDIITIHTDLNGLTKHLIYKEKINSMKPGVVLINTARGEIINTIDLIEGLENKKIAAAGLDVYEKERGVFFYNHEEEDLQDHLLQTLLRMPNVLITPHQAFATNTALYKIAATTFYNLNCWQNNTENANELNIKTTTDIASANDNLFATSLYKQGVLKEHQLF